MKAKVPYSALEHVGRSIWGLSYSRESLFAMLTAYFDDSRRKGFVVAGGWIASVEEWEHFEVDWRLFLIAYKVPYLHMKEYAHSTGPYSKWKNVKNFRARFLHDAWEIIKSRVRGGFVSLVQDIVFNRVDEVYELRETIPSCYALVSRTCMEWAEKRANVERTQCRSILDDPGTGDKCALIRAADVAPKLSNPIFEASRDIPHRKKGVQLGFVHLQSADLLAYEVQKFFSDHALIRTGVRESRASLRMFAEKQPEKMMWSEERLTQLCKGLGIKKRHS